MKETIEGLKYLSSLFVSKLPPFRATVVAARCAERARNLFGSLNTDARAHLNRQELHVIDAAIDVATNIGFYPDTWAKKIGDAEKWSARALRIESGRAETSRHDSDYVRATEGGTERFDSAPYWHATDADIISAELRQRIAGVAGHAAAAASHAGNPSEILQVVRDVREAICDYRRTCEHVTRHRDKPGPELVTPGEALLLRDAMRLRDLCQECTPSLLDAESNIADDLRHEWRFGLLGIGGGQFEKLISAITWPASIATSAKWAALAIEAACRADSSASSQDIQSAAIDVLRSAVRVSLNQGGIGTVSLPSILSESTREVVTPYVAASLDAIRHAVATACHPPIGQRAKALSVNSTATMEWLEPCTVEGCYSVHATIALLASAEVFHLLQLQASRVAGLRHPNRTPAAVIRDLEGLAAMSQQEGWTDETPMPEEFVRLD